MGCIACRLCLLVLQLDFIEAVLADEVSCSGERHLASRPASVSVLGCWKPKTKKQESIADARPSKKN